jgi:tetratricopeptide (TPR) repeat protein
MSNQNNWLEKVKALRAEGSFEKTMIFLNEVAAERPQDPVVYFQIAWTHDALGKETDAVPAYEKAISLGLSGADLEGAYVGLGSTYRCVGDYQNSKRIFELGMSAFPNNGALKAFYAMTLHNLKNHDQAMEVLLKELIRSSSDPETQAYQRAMLFYSDKLNETFE